MNLSMKWLSDYVKIDAPIHDFCEAMTMSGSKVEGYTVEGSEISRVVVGKVLSVEKHPNADSLVVCMLDVAQEQPIQIVTGADNVVPGALVPVALDGSTLPHGVKIRKGKLRGELSNGMMCSLPELALTLHDFPSGTEEGIFLLGEDCEGKPGDDIRPVIGLDDTCVEFEITSNRPDCLSVLGLAREAAATYKVPFVAPQPKVQKETDDSSSAPATWRAWSRMSRSGPPRAGCASGCAQAACVRSTTSWTSPTTSCSNTASRCMPSITSTSRTARSSRVTPAPARR